MMRTVQVQETTMRMPGAVVSLINRGSLDIGQVMAANRFLHNWETMQAPGLRSPDLGRVSGRTMSFADPLSEAYAKACQEMRQAEVELGPRLELVEGALIEGKSLAQLAQTDSSRSPSKHARKTVSGDLKMALNKLALMWGYKARR